MLAYPIDRRQKSSHHVWQKVDSLRSVRTVEEHHGRSDESLREAPPFVLSSRHSDDHREADVVGLSVHWLDIITAPFGIAEEYFADLTRRILHRAGDDERANC